MKKGVVILLFGLLLGCVKVSDETLSIFFDGVSPPPQAVSQQAGQNGAGQDDGPKFQLVFHPPYQDRACKKCHDISDPSNAGLITEMPGLCFKCHESADFENEEGVVHSPVEDGECVECHHPHKSRQDYLLQSPLPKPCFECHDQEDFEVEDGTVHEPVAEGGCTDCHDPHQADHEKLLIDPVPATCFDCHDEDKFKAEKGVVHSPVEDGECMECHHPHASEQDKLLRKPVGETCFGCHDTDEVVVEPEKKGAEIVVHSPVEDGDCAECHNPHASPQEKLLKTPLDQVCFQCHEIGDFLEEAVPEPVVHSPVEDGECAECHNPHSGKLEHMLKKPVETLCFDCHDAEDFQGETVHSPVEDGECAECHSPHVSGREFMLRKSVVETCFGCHDAEDLHPEPVEGLQKHLPWEKNPGACTECHSPHVSEREFLLKPPGG